MDLDAFKKVFRSKLSAAMLGAVTSFGGPGSMVQADTIEPAVEKIANEVLGRMTDEALQELAASDDTVQQFANSIINNQQPNQTEGASPAFDQAPNQGQPQPSQPTPGQSGSPSAQPSSTPPSQPEAPTNPSTTPPTEETPDQAPPPYQPFTEPDSTTPSEDQKNSADNDTEEKNQTPPDGANPNQVNAQAELEQQQAIALEQQRRMEMQVQADQEQQRAVQISSLQSDLAMWQKKYKRYKHTLIFLQTSSFFGAITCILAPLAFLTVPFIFVCRWLKKRAKNNMTEIQDQIEALQKQSTTPPTS